MHHFLPIVSSNKGTEIEHGANPETLSDDQEFTANPKGCRVRDVCGQPRASTSCEVSSPLSVGCRGHSTWSLAPTPWCWGHLQ